jgi:hypothetical protein
MSSDLPRAVQAIIDAANRGDAEAFLAYFTPDGVVDDWGREFRGAPAIAGWSEKEFIGVQVTLEVTGVEGSGQDEVTVAAEVGGNGFNGPSHFTFRVEGDRVARITIRA